MRYYCFHFEKQVGNMPSIKGRCHTCVCGFATWRSLKKHAEKTSYQLNEIKYYRAGKMEPVMLPKPERISQVQNAGYLFLLTGLAELIKSFLRHFLSAFEYEK